MKLDKMPKSATFQASPPSSSSPQHGFPATPFSSAHCIASDGKFTLLANLKSNLSMMVFMLYAPHFLTDGTHTGTILNVIVSKKVKTTRTSQGDKVCILIVMPFV